MEPGKGSRSPDRSRPKLVRDLIPDFIRAAGLEPFVSIASPDEFLAGLRDKLVEEARECAETPTVEEFADVLEVLRALAAALDVTMEEVEATRVAKREERGGFDRRLIWHGNRELES